MKRSLVATILTVAAVCFVASHQTAAAGQPHAVAWGSGQPGIYLSPTAAYPTAPVYYTGAATHCQAPLMPRAAASVSSHGALRVVSGETRPDQPAASVAAPAQPMYVYQCQCERCRRERDTGLSRLLRDLWELEQRKNAFLGRVLFGD